MCVYTTMDLLTSYNGNALQIHFVNIRSRQKEGILEPFKEENGILLLFIEVDHSDNWIWMNEFQFHSL